MMKVNQREWRENKNNERKWRGVKNNERNEGEWKIMKKMKENKS